MEAYDCVHEAGLGFTSRVYCTPEIPGLRDRVWDGVLFDDKAGERTTDD